MEDNEYKDSNITGKKENYLIDLKDIVEPLDNFNFTNLKETEVLIEKFSTLKVKSNDDYLENDEDLYYLEQLINLEFSHRDLDSKISLVHGLLLNFIKCRNTKNLIYILNYVGDLSDGEFWKSLNLIGLSQYLLDNGDDEYSSLIYDLHLDFYELHSEPESNINN
jgi:hypothetical protein